MHAAAAVGSMGSARGASVSAGPLRFRSSPRAVLIVKELRLIRRDPLLLMQLLQQSIYLVPLCLLLWRQSRGGPGAGKPLRRSSHATRPAPLAVRSLQRPGA
jgi:hypothetical protein